MNELIEIPHYNIPSANLVEQINVYLNDIIQNKYTNSVPIYISNSRIDKNRLLKFYMKFHFHSNEMIEWLMKLKLSKNLVIERFVSRKEKTTFAHANKLGTWTVKVKYVEVREELISYLEQTIGMCKKISELKMMFASDNKLSFDEYIDKKSSYLLSLDLDNYVESLNQNTALNKMRISEQGPKKSTDLYS